MLVFVVGRLPRTRIKILPTSTRDRGRIVSRTVNIFSRVYVVTSSRRKRFFRFEYRASGETRERIAENTSILASRLEIFDIVRVARFSRVHRLAKRRRSRGKFQREDVHTLRDYLKLEKRGADGWALRAQSTRKLTDF